MEKTFTLFPSRDKEYGLAMFANELTGEIHFADLKLEAISEGARNVLLPAFYADLDAEYWLTERAGFYLGATYQKSCALLRMPW